MAHLWLIHLLKMVMLNSYVDMYFCFTTIETVHDLDIQGLGMHLPIESVEISQQKRYAQSDKQDGSHFFRCPFPSNIQ